MRGLAKVEAAQREADDDASSVQPRAGTERSAVDDRADGDADAGTEPTPARGG